MFVVQYTNLADYYGHAGRIQGNLYEHVLKSLSYYPQKCLCQKRIAWIVFSILKKKPNEALRILDSVTKNFPVTRLLPLEGLKIAEYYGQKDRDGQQFG